jgi:5-methylthioadenosine/S-adenosylhomocysteine deaminase
MSEADTLIENAVLITMDPERRVLPRGHLLIRDGRIAAIGPGEYARIRDRVVVKDVRGQIVLPGLVDAHHHSYGNLLKGHIEATPLELYFLYVLAEAPSITTEDTEIACALGSLELLESGCTAVLDHLTQRPAGLAAAAAIYRRVGIRAMLTPQFSNLSFTDTMPSALAKTAAALGPAYAGPSQDPQPILEKVEQVVQECHRPQDGVTVAIGPSAPVRCSDSLLTGSVELARRYGLQWHTHLLESPAQVAKAAERYGHSMVEHLANLGALDSRASLAHAIWLSGGDWDRIRSSEATIVHVPVANLQLGDGLFSFPEALRRGVNLALGTDSSACAGCQSMFETMKLAAILGRVIEPDARAWPTSQSALEAATLGGARALGLQNEIGSLELEKSADFVILRRNVPALTPLHNATWQVVFGRPERAVDEVWIRGRPVLVGGRLAGFDREVLLKEAEDRGVHLLARCAAAYVEIQKHAPAFAAAIAKLAPGSASRASAPPNRNTGSE